MPLLDELKTKREQILSLAKSYGVKDVRVFGSAVRGEDTEASDLDLLIELEPERSLLDAGGFQYDVQELMGRKVDVVFPKGLHHRIRDAVLHEARPL